MNEAYIPNEPQDELAKLALAAREAMTDSIVERLFTTGANSMEVLDRLNDHDTRDAILNILDRVTELHKVGALDTMFDLLTLIHGSRRAFTDTIVERLFMFVEHMVNTVGSEELGTLAANARVAVDDAVNGHQGPAPKGGIWTTLTMLSTPEAQQTLGFLLRAGANFRALTSETRTGV